MNVDTDLIAELDPDLVIEWIAKLVYLTDGNKDWHTVRGAERERRLASAKTMLGCSGLMPLLETVDRGGDAKDDLRALMLRALNSAETLDASRRYAELSNSTM